MPPKKAKKQKPFEKLQDFVEAYKKNCELFGVEPLDPVMDIYNDAIIKKAKKQPIMLQFADEEVNPDRIRPLIETYQTTDVKIKILSFLNTKSGDGGLHALAHALKQPLELVGLAYHANNVGPSGCRAIARGFVESKFLTILELDFNAGIGDEGVAGLCHYGHCPSLNRLSLSFCNIGDKGAETLAKWLAKPECQIKELILKGNQIGPLGATAIGANLPDNNSLNRLDLSDNVFGYNAECLNALHDGIKGCAPLNAVLLLNNFECPEGLAEKFLTLVTEKPLGEFQLTVKMDANTFQNTRAISLTNAKKIAKEAKRKKKPEGETARTDGASAAPASTSAAPTGRASEAAEQAPAAPAQPPAEQGE
ncbi:Leucine Rich Repeat family protein [Trichomonas vaginalis G3]|uniref:Leucine Rich Repeat family protein n=1 Tax=Trichomonas vaginalis (strain ATCC PRA-98 / G3) TaxID=412133 RepID=A2D7P4_TRIV3|nr:uncharacterized protein TVAGG3_0994370 [Trichomonas vaginalis G3]EAY23761.1 Leucine Rich Repeat family protein [Trichomonas vaginalis G3]KAI5490273.1 Ran GTPase-activating protein 1 family [Trichomonas vaginalis G3]|eukprot:XP_001277009.1 hypothetical protein [Trichomonas vaginalis G3]